jgi:hypothetical protein
MNHNHLGLGWGDFLSDTFKKRKRMLNYKQEI